MVTHYAPWPAQPLTSNLISPSHACLPFLHSSPHGGERAAYLVDLAGIMGVGSDVASRVDLRQSLSGRMVELELEDVDIIGRLDHQVGDSVRIGQLIEDQRLPIGYCFIRRSSFLQIYENYLIQESSILEYSTSTLQIIQLKKSET